MTINQPNVLIVHVLALKIENTGKVFILILFLEKSNKKLNNREWKIQICLKGSCFNTFRKFSLHSFIILKGLEKLPDKSIPKWLQVPSKCKVLKNLLVTSIAILVL